MTLRLPVLAAVVLCACGPRNVRPTTDEKVELTAARLERGRYLVQHVANCGACHTTRDSGVIEDPENPAKELGGNVWMRDDSVGFAIWIPNITSDPDSGVGKWTDDQLMRAIRDGIRPDKRPLLPFMPYGDYRHMSDEDLRAVVAYLRSVPPQRTPLPRPENKLPFPFEALTSWGMFSSDPAMNVSAPDRANPVKSGEYLAHLGHCPDCHALGGMGPRKPDDPEFMGGSQGSFGTPGYGKVWARNLTPDKETGLGRYSDEQILGAILGGHRLDGKRWAPPMSLFAPHLAGLKLEDGEALVAYLRSLKPVKHQVPERQLTAEGKQKLGE